MTRKKIALLFLLLICCFIGIIYTLNNIYHSNLCYVYDTENQLAYVTKKPSGKQYKGNIEIPSTTQYEGQTFKVVGIKQGAFSDCRNLKSVIIPNSVTEIGDSAFYWCSKMKSVEIPNSVTKIGKWAFEYSGLTSLSIPNSITIIRDGAFSTCDITTLSIPSSVKEIGEGAFSFCHNLTSVNISNGVKEIDEKAFLHCSALTSVEIPNSMTIIRDGAFYGCSKLKKVTCKAVVPPHAAMKSFLGVSYENEKQRKLYVPKASLEAYREHKVWRQFKQIIGVEEFD